MAPTDIARSSRPLDRGVPTQHTRRPRLLTAAAALLLAVAVAAYPAQHAVAVAAAFDGPAVLLVLVALVGLWDDALVAGSALLLIGYVVSLSTGHRPYDSVAPLVAAALATLVDLGSWSLELREGPESATLHHVRTLLAIAIGALATGAAVFAAGNTRAGGGIALWLIGAAAAAGLLAIIRAHRATASLPSRRKSSFQAGSG